MSTGLLIALVAVVLAVALGGYRALTDGRFRRGETTRADEEQTAWDHVTAAVPGTERGERATLVQFSSAFCAPCRVTRQVLGDVAGIVPGVRHVEIDAEQHLALVRALGITRTPTTLVLDAAGRETTRAAGAPRREAVLASLGHAVPD